MCLDNQHIATNQKIVKYLIRCCNVQAFWILSFRIDINYNNVIRANYEQFEALITVDLAYFLGTATKHISIWQVKPDGGKSVVYFRYLFDTDDEDETQIVGGDIMVLAGSEIADDSSTAQRGFLMKYTDASYEFVYCIPTKEECDPSSQVNMSMVLLVCFLCSFVFEIIVFAVYRRLTRDRRQRRYEEELDGCTLSEIVHRTEGSR